MVCPVGYRHSVERYRRLYAVLIRLYPKPYRDRFGEGMQQTFRDLCRERMASGKTLLALLVWVFIDTSVGIAKERIAHMREQSFSKRMAVWGIVVACVLVIPLVAMQFTSEVVWGLADFVVAGILLFGAGLVYELVSSRGNSLAYRMAVGIAVAAALLLIWMDLALATEGDNSGGLIYVGVVVLGIGAVIARLRPRGMARALFATAVAQVVVAVVAMVAWGQYVEFIILNGLFIALWVGSALLFRRASVTASQ